MPSSADHQPISTNEFPVETDEDVRYLTNIFSAFKVNAHGNVRTHKSPTISVKLPAPSQSPIFFLQATEIIEPRQK